MNIDYSKLIQDSFKYTWKNKSLWILGFIAFFVTGIFSFVTSPSSEGSLNMSDQSGMYLLLGCIFFFVAIGYAFFSWYISRRAENSLVLAARNEFESEQISFKDAWRMSETRIFKTMLLDFVFWLFFVLSILILVVPVALIAVALNNPAFLLLLCCMLFILLPVMFIIGSVYYLANFLILTKEIELFASIKEGFSIFKANWTKVLVFDLILVALGFGYGLIIAVPFYILYIPYVLLVTVLQGDAINNIVAMLIAIGGGVLLSAIYGVLMAPYLTFIQTIRTRFNIEIIER